MAVKEIWRSIPGYKGYQASNLGNIRSIDRFLPDGRWRHGQMIKQSIDTGGYPTVTLGHRGQWRIHRLVVMAFRGLPSVGFDVRHLNGHKTDNRLVNLSYGTRAQNEYDKLRHGKWNHGTQRQVTDATNTSKS